MLLKVNKNQPCSFSVLLSLQWTLNSHIVPIANMKNRENSLFHEALLICIYSVTLFALDAEWLKIYMTYSSINGPEIAT